MSGKFNPFRPNSTASPGLFCGRHEELTTIEQCLFQTKHGNPQHFLIEGERGIGKSSLMVFEMNIATGKIDNSATEKFNFLSVSTVLKDTDTQAILIKGIAQRLRNEVAKIERFKDFANRTWNFISKIEAAGIRLNIQDKPFDESELLQSLIEDIVDITNRLDDMDGILLLIDEADKGALTTQLGLFCKILSEELTSRGAEKLCIGLAGQSNTVELLRNSHESSPRLFRCLDLQPLSSEERHDVIKRGLDDANKKNELAVTIENSAMEFLSDLSEGYPHFLQEFAFCAFDTDHDGHIDTRDVLDSILGENGALDQLGKKYFNHVYNTPGSDNYRVLLRAMAEHGDGWIERNALIKEAQISESVIDNGLRALKRSNIIIQDEAQRGRYRLPTRSFATWIKIKATAEAKDKPVS